MWNKRRSVILTQIIVRLCYVILAVCAAVLPFVTEKYAQAVGISFIAEYGRFILAPFYLVVPAGYAALVCIDKLLINIKKEVVFDKVNVRLLRIISRCCFYAAAVGILSFSVMAAAKYPYASLIILASGEAFMGLVVRVVKNVFEAAIEIKEENELTI